MTITTSITDGYVAFVKQGENPLQEKALRVSKGNYGRENISTTSDVEKITIFCTKEIAETYVHYYNRSHRVKLDFECVRIMRVTTIKPYDNQKGDEK